MNLENQNDFLKEAHIHMKTHDKEYYTNTMKGYLKPFWMKDNA